MERFKPVLKESVLLALGQISAALGAIMGVRLLTEHLNPSLYGELALWTTVATLINQTILGPLSNGITRFYAPASEFNDFGGYISAVNTLVKQALLVICVFAVLMCAILLKTDRAAWISIAAAFFVFSSFNGCSGILSGIQNAARQRRSVAFFQGADPWLRFLSATGCVIIFGATSTNAAYGYAAASSLIFLVQYFIFRKANIAGLPAKETIALNWSAEIWKFSWPFASWGLFTWARLASDRWALDIFTSKQEVGFYAVVFQLGYYPMSLATGMATQLFAPILYQRAGYNNSIKRTDNAKSLSLKLVEIALLGTLSAFFITLMFHSKIVSLLASPEYSEVSYLFPWVVLSGGIFASAQMVGLDLMTRLKTQMLVFCTVTTALAGIAMNFAGAYYLGIGGVVGAGLVYSTIYFLWMYSLYKKTNLASELTNKVVSVNVVN